MEFAIYCYGTGEILWKVFNGLALIFGRSGFVDSSIAISASVGALWAVTRSIWGANIGLFARSWFLPTFLIFNLVFLPKVSVNIVDRVDPTWKFSSVSNVPLGVAFFPSIASHFSFLLTEQIDQYLSPCDGVGFAHTGDLFAAKFIQAVKDVRIVDSVEQSNLKHFVNRCFLWPRIYVNSEGLRAEAKKTDTILGFIKAHPHHWCGSYWEEKEGNKVFLKCAQGAQRAEKIMKLEIPKVGRTLTSKFFNWNQDKDPEGILMQKKLKRLIPKAWEEITGKSQEAFDVIQQYIMMNAFRESRDDDREASHLPRLFPELVTLQSARTQAQQNLVNLISGDVAGSYIPTAQGALFATLILLFILIVPLTFMPGGFSLFITWVRLIFWVSLWPVFFAMFESLASFFLIKAGRTQLLSGEGVSLLTQSGLSDVAFDYYSYFNANYV